MFIVKSIHSENQRFRQGIFCDYSKKSKISTTADFALFRVARLYCTQLFLSAPAVGSMVRHSSLGRKAWSSMLSTAAARACTKSIYVQKMSCVRYDVCFRPVFKKKIIFIFVATFIDKPSATHWTLNQ